MWTDIRHLNLACQWFLPLMFCFSFRDVYDAFDTVLFSWATAGMVVRIFYAKIMQSAPKGLSLIPYRAHTHSHRWWEWEPTAWVRIPSSSPVVMFASFKWHNTLTESVIQLLYWISKWYYRQYRGRKMSLIDNGSPWECRSGGNLGV